MDFRPKSIQIETKALTDFNSILNLLLSIGSLANLINHEGMAGRARGMSLGVRLRRAGEPNFVLHPDGDRWPPTRGFRVFGSSP